MQKFRFPFKTLLLVVSLFYSFIIQAQSDFRPGYIIKSKGDTLFGQVDYRSDQRMGELCTFRKEENAIAEEFLPGAIIGFRFTDGRYFVSNLVDGKLIFLEFLVKGRVNLYYSRSMKGERYFLEKEGSPLTELPYEEGVKEIDGKRYYFESKKHIGFLKYYLSDAPVLDSKLITLGRPDHESLIQIAEDYHNVVCDGEKCIIYKKKLPPFKMNLELLGGAFFSSKLDESLTLRPLQGGVIGHIWQPKTDERFYFRTGILFSGYQYGTEKGIVSKIPIQAEYLYPTGEIRPRVALGMNFYFLSGQILSTPSSTIGLNIGLTKNVDFTITGDIDFIPGYVILPKQFFSVSFLTGFSVTL
jgi:hypothetical protein